MVRVARKTGATPTLAPTRYGVLYRKSSGLITFTAAELAEMLGHVVLKTMPQVAQVFGLSPHTINQGWRQAGMPGVSGHYDLAEITAWRLARDFEAAEKTRSKPLESKEKLERELLEIKVEDARREQQLKAGELVDVRKGQAEVAKAMAVFRESELSVSGAIAPMLPAEIAPNICAEIDKVQRHNLTALHEALLRAVKS